MFREPKRFSRYAFAALMLSFSFGAMAQQQAKLPKLNPFLPPPVAANANIGAANVTANPGANTHSSGSQLQTFNYTVTATRDGNTYSGTMVGRSPFDNPFGFTKVSTRMVPIIVVTNSVFAGTTSAGAIITAPGITTFDPTIADPSCLTAPNDVPLTLMKQSPIFQPAAFNFGGTNVGFTQTTDAFERANFFEPLNFGPGPSDTNITYHVILSPVRTVSAIMINVPAASGVAYPSSVFGGCPAGMNAIIDFAFYQSALKAALTGLVSQGVNPSMLPMFFLHNIVECEGTNCGALAPNTACCILGFHSAVGPQTFASVDFDTSEIFVSPVPDVSVASHEVGEWMDDPFGNNPTPAWGHVGQVSGCQSNLEVGDPLSGTLAPPIFNPANGFTYHMQELAFFSWFYGAPSIGIHGWFSDNATFLQDAGPVCH